MVRNRKYVLWLSVAVVWLLASACSCSDLLATLSERDSTSGPTATSTSGILAEAQTRTRTATLTRAPTRTRTPTPTRAVVAGTPSPAIDEMQGIPTTPDTPFDVTLTEEQINDYLAGQVVSESGIEVSDPQVTLGDGEAMVHVNAYQEASNIRVGLTVRGTPVVYEGDLYVRVEDVTLDDTVKGFTRLLARTVIEAALKQYSGCLLYTSPSPRD